MSTSRIGLIGGISWESTAEYYRLFNQMVDKSRSPHNQPRLLIDSLDFAEIVVHQESNN
jgi:aspartate racemase